MWQIFTISSSSSKRCCCHILKKKSSQITTEATAWQPSTGVALLSSRQKHALPSITSNRRNNKKSERKQPTPPTNPTPKHCSTTADQLSDIGRALAELFPAREDGDGEGVGVSRKLARDTSRFLRQTCHVLLGRSRALLPLGLI